jgi:hypothetical protein
MSPGISFHFFHRAAPRAEHRSAWAAIVAVLFAAVAAISFAVDQSITLSTLPAPPAHSGLR